MNGFKVSVNADTSSFDRHTFLAPSNVLIPDAVGMYFSHCYSSESMMVLNCFV
jgi:hypothetical protein